jgi:hypothetical protein
VSTERYPLQTVAELEARVHAERSGTPFLVFRDGAGRQQLVALAEDDGRVYIGRSPQEGIQLAWDKQVSRIHAWFEHVSGAWTITDHGTSRNGTFVNELRLHGCRTLRDGDVVRCGRVTLHYHDPGASGEETIKAAETLPSPARLSPQQSRVLTALCRPLIDRSQPVPATNKEIATEVHLSVDAVKTHLRRASEILEIGDVPQNRKRMDLALTAIRSGVVSERDLAAKR